MLLQVLQPTTCYLLVLLWAGVHGDGHALPILFYTAYLISNAAMVYRAIATLPISSRAALADVFRLRKVHGARIVQTARPMAIIAVSLAIALQSDRLIVSHMTNTKALAEFSLGAQFFAPLGSLIAVASAAIWPHFARRRRMSQEVAISWRTIAWLTGLTFGACTFMLFVLPGISRWFSDGELVLGRGLLFSFSALLIVQSVQGPVGNMLTDPGSLKFQARCVVLALPINLGLSILLTSWIGNSGPLIGTAFATLFVQVLPALVFVRLGAPYNFSSRTESK